MLEARDITFGYPGVKPLYSGFSLQVEPGERVALQAPSGFGKTTLCRVLAGFERPQAGEVLLDGRPLPRRGVCPVQLIQQHPEQAIDPRLRMRKTLAEAGDVPQELLDNLGIRDEWMQRYPHELSGGELQRFCIARALATRPRYLICDEVSTMLDAVTQAHIWRVLLDYAEREGAGMLLVSHTPALTERVATRKVKLSRGKSCFEKLACPYLLMPCLRIVPDGVLLLASVRAVERRDCLSSGDGGWQPMLVCL